MFSLPSSFPKLFSISSVLGGKSSEGIALDPVKVFDIETGPEKRSRTLKHLLKLNHATHSILYNQGRFHNHLPHILGSAYLLGSGESHLGKIYEEEAQELEKWQDSPGEISRHDWRDYLGDAGYQRAFIDFFEDELVSNGYDWRKVLAEYLFEGKEPLVNGAIICGLGHPLIHLGYAFELSSRELAMEALGLAACCYDPMHKYLDSASYTDLSSKTTASTPLDLLSKIANDKRLDGLYDRKGLGNIEKLFCEHEAVALQHWNAWQIVDPKRQFQDSQYAAVALLTATQTPHDPSYDFFLVHLLTSSHAVRILLPFIPAKFHVPLVRQWWLFTLSVYIAQLRPNINLNIVHDYDLDGRDWDWTFNQTLNGKWATDAHYVKAIRAMRAAHDTWGDQDSFYLKAAVKFASEFSGWF